MAFLGFVKEFSRNRAIASNEKFVRNNYIIAQEGAQKDLAASYKNGAEALGKAKEAYANARGLPTAASSEEEKANYREFMANYGSQIKAGAQQHANGLVGDVYKNTTADVMEKIKQTPLLTAGDAESIIKTGWSDTELHTGIMDIFNKTADARATALGITKFRGTNGAMGTLNSARSLFYKDNTHLNDGVAVAGVLGGTLATGMLAGKAIGAGLDAAYVDRD